MVFQLTLGRRAEVAKPGFSLCGAPGCMVWGLIVNDVGGPPANDNPMTKISANATVPHKIASKISMRFFSGPFNEKFRREGSLMTSDAFFTGRIFSAIQIVC